MNRQAQSTSSNDRQLAAKAEAQIQLAIRRLGGRYVFHARVIEQFVLRHMAGLATMGVSVFGDKVMLGYNTQFVLGLPLEQLMGVLVHEIHHVLFKHMLLDPNDFANKAALTVAEELVVNEFVGEPLPEGAITLAMFPKFPPMESTLERYQRLQKIISPSAAKPLKLPFGSTSKRQGSGGSIPTVVDDHSVWGAADNDQGQSPGKSPTPSTSPGQGQTQGQGQTPCPGLRQDQRQAEALIDNLIRNTAHNVGADNVPDYIKRMLGGLFAGSEAGTESEELVPISGTLDWVRLLRRYVGEALHLRRLPTTGSPFP